MWEGNSFNLTVGVLDGGIVLDNDFVLGYSLKIVSRGESLPTILYEFIEVDTDVQKIFVTTELC